jgi:hypothetical protein
MSNRELDFLAQLPKEAVHMQWNESEVDVFSIGKTKGADIKHIYKSIISLL